MALRASLSRCVSSPTVWPCREEWRQFWGKKFESPHCAECGSSPCTTASSCLNILGSQAFCNAFSRNELCVESFSNLAIACRSAHFQYRLHISHGVGPARGNGHEVLLSRYLAQPDKLLRGANEKIESEEKSTNMIWHDLQWIQIHLHF